MGIRATTACNRTHTVIIRIIDLHILSVLAVSFQFLSLVLVSSPQRVSFVDCDVLFFCVTFVEFQPYELSFFFFLFLFGTQHSILHTSSATTSITKQDNTSTLANQQQQTGRSFLHEISRDSTSRGADVAFPTQAK